jgi:hypothetical protein
MLILEINNLNLNLKVLTLFKGIFDNGLGKTPSKIEFEPEDLNLMKNITFHGTFHQFYLPYLINLKSYNCLHDIALCNTHTLFWFAINNFFLRLQFY